MLVSWDFSPFLYYEDVYLLDYPWRFYRWLSALLLIRLLVLSGWDHAVLFDVSKRCDAFYLMYFALMWPRSHEGCAFQARHLCTFLTILSISLGINHDSYEIPVSRLIYSGTVEKGDALRPWMNMPNSLPSTIYVGNIDTYSYLLHSIQYTGGQTKMTPNILLPPNSLHSIHPRSQNLRNNNNPPLRIPAILQDGSQHTRNSHRSAIHSVWEPRVLGRASNPSP